MSYDVAFPVRKSLGRMPLVYYKWYKAFLQCADLSDKYSFQMFYGLDNDFVEGGRL